MSMDDFALTERLQRLVESSLGPKEVLKYTKNLKEFAEQVARAKDEIRRMSRVFKALSHPTRLKILKLLDTRDMCVRDHGGTNRDATHDISSFEHT